MWARRLTTDDGEALIGRVLDAELVRAARASFGLDGGPAMTGEETFEAIMGRGITPPLANGWRLARRRIKGADRVEIEGPADTDVGVLRRIGCTVEIVSYRARAFAPAAQVLERWPLGRLNPAARYVSPVGPMPERPPPPPAPPRRGARAAGPPAAVPPPSEEVLRHDRPDPRRTTPTNASCPPTKSRTRCSRSASS